MIVAKANSARSFLQRNLTKCPPTVKSSYYSTLVRLIIEYACTVWSSYHQQNVLKLEKIPSAIRIWNSLPSDIVKAETLDLFKPGLNM